MSLKTSVKSLFAKAKEKSEFNFICSLIDYKEMAHIKNVSNLREWFEAIEYYESIYNSEEDLHKKLRIGLVIYSTFFESSELYSLMGNLSRNILGYRGVPYLYWRHRNADRWLGTAEKVSLVTGILSDVDCQEIVDFFNKTHYKQIRNSFFHSSYSLEGNDYHIQNSEPIFINDRPNRNLNITNFLIPKIEGVLEFFHLFKAEYFSQFNSYTSNKKVKGNFPVEMDIIILGSENGLCGFETSNSSIQLKDDFWEAMNITFGSPDETRRFVIDELERFLSKERIRGEDGSLKHLHEVIKERDIQDEKESLGTVYQKLADIRYKMAEEKNDKERSYLRGMALSFYQKMLNIDDSRKITNDIACLKYLVGADIGKGNLIKESLDDFLNCIDDIPEANSIKNSLIILKELNAKGINTDAEKSRFVSLLNGITNPELEDLKQETLTEID